VAAAEIVIPDPTTVTHMSGAGIHRFEEVVSRGNARFRREAGVAHADVDDVVRESGRIVSKNNFSFCSRFQSETRAASPNAPSPRLSLHA
jgi:hypothetical protein